MARYSSTLSQLISNSCFLIFVNIRFTAKRLFYDKYHDEIMNGDEICLRSELGIQTEKSMEKLLTETRIIPKYLD